MFNYKKFFPIFSMRRFSYPLTYLDNAATTQLPRSVIEKFSYYAKFHANVNRGVYFLSSKITEKYNVVREKVKQFINAEYDYECIFVRGATEAINLVACSYGQLFLKYGDEILLTLLEHHSNIIPWQMLCKKVGACIKVISINISGELDLSKLSELITSKTKFVSISYVSNTLGIINDVKTIIKFAHRYNIPVLVDGAQAVAHIKIDVRELDCDFFVFSAHKMYGPSGVGVLYGKSKYLNIMNPYHGGGDMVSDVRFDYFVSKELPHKFEAGTPAITSVLAFGDAIDFLNTFNFNLIMCHEKNILLTLLEKLNKISGLYLIGNSSKRIAIVSFILNNIHAHDVATLVNEKGVAVRSGHHCAFPLMRFFNVNSTIRCSLGLYNDFEDVDRFINSLIYVKSIFKK